MYEVYYWGLLAKYTTLGSVKTNTGALYWVYALGVKWLCFGGVEGARVASNVIRYAGAGITSDALPTKATRRKRWNEQQKRANLLAQA